MLKVTEGGKMEENHLRFRNFSKISYLKVLILPKDSKFMADVNMQRLKIFVTRDGP